LIEGLLAKKPLYPLCCIAFSAAMLMGGLFISKRPSFAVLLAAICAVYMVFGYARPFLRCMAVVLPACLVVGLVALLVRGMPWDAAAALQASGRILLLGLCAVPTISLPPVNLTRCMARLGCPRALTLGMLVAVRFVPVLAGEMSRIREAMMTRGVRLALNPSYAYRAFLVPLAMRLTGISDVLALSLETRCFDIAPGAGGATAFRPVRFGARDAAFCAVSAALVVWMAVWA
jgi:energy-coupling factor transporter transmembrane protein EcfT